MSVDLIRRETMPLDTIILPIELINYTNDKISITWQLHNNESIDWVALQLALSPLKYETGEWERDGGRS